MVGRGPEPEHGTLRRYRRPWKCRCEQCRSANAEAQYRRRHDLDPLAPYEVVYGQRAKPEPPGVGTRSCYNRGCDHPECAQANRDYAREYKRDRGGAGYPLPGYRESSTLDEHL
jgi:hypothetical protein